jgi:nitrite reductase/ring-hydroxylating ferredoxin subunit
MTAIWTPIARLEDCPPGNALECLAAGRIIALYNVDGQFFALDGLCPHQGGPLGKGSLDGCILTCPWHGWQFDVRTGQSQLSANIRQPGYEVRVENEQVLVKLELD